MKKIIALAAALLLVLGSLSACGAASLVGKWRIDYGDLGIEFEFRSNGTYTYYDELYGTARTGTYRTSGNKLILEDSEGGREEVTFRIDGSVMDLGDGDATATFRRK